MSKPYYTLSIDETYLGLSTHQTGLTTEDAAHRLQKDGPNILQQKKKISPWQIFFDQFKDLLIIILLFAGGISLVLGLVEDGGSITEGLLIFFIVIAIALVGFLNEYKAEKTIEALKKLVGQSTRVRRNGQEIQVEAKDLVAGDIVLLEEGQKVPADIRLTKVIELKVNEASLTGESLPVTKTIEPIQSESALGDQKNMVFSGTIIATGKGEGVVVGTGQNTEIGKIATLVEEAGEEETPMQKKLDALGKQLGSGVLLVCAVVFVAIFFLDKEFQSVNVIQRLLLAFTAAVALAVAAIPEGLAFVVRISLALGARRMAARNALVRRLSAVEALGSTDIICSDKTGTLTKGEMTVREIWTDGKAYGVSGTGYSNQGEFTLEGKKLSNLSPLEPVLTVGLLCNDAHIKEEKVMGDPTEGALVIAAHKAGIHDKVDLPRVGEVPFSSDRKMMSTVHHQGKDFMVSVKGACEIVLDHCDSILLDGKAAPLTAEIKKQILSENQRMASDALRVLAFAHKVVNAEPKGADQIEAKLTFVGLQGMMDPPRTEIKQVIETVTTQAGMRVVMITGDYIETAKAVASQIGITGKALSGQELDKLSEAEFKKIVNEIGIYARVNPEHKIRIVKALKSNGFQVAMTGDGVNDAPAIKAADIGIAMGKTGTDVAKEAADLILLDDQFLTIINAIEEGRGIFDNVRKFVNYLLSANIAEVITVLFGLLFFSELAVTAVQLLFINIVTDGLPAIALGSDPAEKGIMRYKPTRFQGQIIDKKLWISMVSFGLLMSAAILGQFSYNLKAHDLTYAISGAFTAMVVLEMIRLIDIRSYYKVSWRSNPWLVVAIASSIIIQVVVVMTPVSKLFGVVSISLADWGFVFVSGVVLYVAMRVINAVLNRLIKDPAPKLTASPLTT